MNNDDAVAKQTQQEEHSLPGTNQAGKRPTPVDHDDDEKRPPEGDSQPQEQIDDHSLPGTNQAGKGPKPIQDEHPNSKLTSTTRTLPDRNRS